MTARVVDEHFHSDQFGGSMMALSALRDMSRVHHYYRQRQQATNLYFQGATVHKGWLLRAHGIP
jgi:hypothetical protein